MRMKSREIQKICGFRDQNYPRFWDRDQNSD